MRLCNFLSDGTPRPAVLAGAGTLADMAIADPALAANPGAVLAEGDVVEVDIEGVGCLRNPVVSAPAQER
jgi:2-keto-4-pentenoate hydratase/2-oxohepta-3-ene-1,7-dioic acid hydratase in catechol pathway